MKTWKIGIITAVSALGLFAASAANAQEYYGSPTVTVARPVQFYRRPARYRTYWYRGRWVRRPIYVQPVVQTPVYTQPVYNQPVYNQPVYTQPVYNQPSYDNGCDAFADQVRAELQSIEYSVRLRVADGELDGNALTTLESARDDMLQDVSDLSAKGYVTDADRAHIERDMQLLREKLGC
jgi:hypothetical protein